MMFKSLNKLRARIKTRLASNVTMALAYVKKSPVKVIS